MKENSERIEMSVNLADAGTVPQLTTAAAEVLAHFGMQNAAKREIKLWSIAADRIDNPPPRVLITGPSGSGKSSMLRLFSNRLKAVVHHPDDFVNDEYPIIDTFSCDAYSAVAFLTSAGITDPMSWGRTAPMLSDGQRARLRLAHALNSTGSILLIDEFTTGLDDLTARAVAYSTRKTAAAQGKTLIVATCDDRIVRDFAPHLHIRLHWAQDPGLAYSSAHSPMSTLRNSATVSPCSHRTYKLFESLHYAAGAPFAPIRTFRIDVEGEPQPAGICVLNYGPPAHAGRNQLSDGRWNFKPARKAISQMNRELLSVARIVIAPHLRGAGLATKLLNEIALAIPEEYLECSATMASFVPFLESAYFKTIPMPNSDLQEELIGWAHRSVLPARALLDPSALQEHIDTCSVRNAKNARQLIWHFYWKCVLERKKNSPTPGRIPNPSDERWPDAFAFAAKRLTGRPIYGLRHTPTNTKPHGSRTV